MHAIGIDADHDHPRRVDSTLEPVSLEGRAIVDQTYYALHMDHSKRPA